MREIGSTVYVAEWGHGARRGTVERAYVETEGPLMGQRVVVRFPEEGCPRNCYAGSCYDTAAEADAACVEAVC